MLKKGLRALLYMLVSLTYIVGAAASENPYQLMQRLCDTTFERLANEKMLIRKNPDHLRKIAEEELLPYVHVEYIGALALGRYFQAAQPEERAEFFKVLRPYLAKLYGQALASYKGQAYQVESPEFTDTKNLLSTRVELTQPDNKKLLFEFKWRKNTKTGHWQIYDLRIEGVSLLNTKQSEWGEILRNSRSHGKNAQKTGLSQLITVLNEEIAQPIPAPSTS